MTPSLRIILLAFVVGFGGCAGVVGNAVVVEVGR
jgi:hypothetical protein